MPHRYLLLLSTLDWVALATFFAGWAGYSYYSDHAIRATRGLHGITYRHRLAWGREMVKRENRIADAALIGNLMNSVSFYANTTIYIVAGLMAVAGTLDKLVTVTEDLPFVHAASREILEAKVFLLIGIFIFAYFKFTWSLRQFNFLVILLGSTPPSSASAVALDDHARRFGALNALSGDEFNGGIRAYYFGFSVLAWFVNPALFIVFTLAIVAILYRRDFRSHTLAALSS